MTAANITRMTPISRVDTTSNSGNAHHLTNILRATSRRINLGVAGAYVKYWTWCMVPKRTAGTARRIATARSIIGAEAGKRNNATKVYSAASYC